MEGCDREGRARSALVLVGAFALLSGCAHVNEEQFASEMDLLRQEIRAQDRAVEERLGDRMDQMDGDVERRLSALESELGALRSDFDVTVERLESAIRFNAPVHFAFDDAGIPMEGEAVLDHFARVVSAYYAGTVITVEGFTDPAGSEAYNLELGELRAEAVKDYLEAAGIPAERMRAVSYGEASERQIVPESQGPGDTGWQNRRVSIVIDFSESNGRSPLAMN